MDASSFYDLPITLFTYMGISIGKARNYYV